MGALVINMDGTPRLHWCPQGFTHPLATYIDVIYSLCYTHLQHEDLAGGAVDVEFAVGRIVRINALAGQEVHNVLGSIFVTVGGRHLCVCVNGEGACLCVDVGAR